MDVDELEKCSLVEVDQKKGSGIDGRHLFNKKVVFLNSEKMKKKLFSKILTFWGTFGIETLIKLLCQKYLKIKIRETNTLLVLG